MSIIDKIKQNLDMQTLLNYYGLDKDKKGFYKCNGENSNSLRIYGNKFKCFSCNSSGDVIDFIKHEERCDQKTAIQKAINIANIDNLTPEQQKENAKKIEAAKPKPIDPRVIEENKQLSIQYCESCFKTRKYEYLLSRGISREIQDKCRVGYDLNKQTIVIPYNKKGTYFIARSAGTQKEFYKPPQDALGPEPIWNAAALNEAGATVYVCEGQIDAMSLMEIGYKACSVGGTNGGHKLQQANIKANIIIAFDNDQPNSTGVRAGTEAAKQLCKTLNCTMIEPVNFKDWNEWLQNDRKELELFIKGELL